MHFVRFVQLSFVLWTLRNVGTEKYEEAELLYDAMNALYNGLQFMEDHVSEINLDGAFGCRLVEELLNAFLESRSIAPEKKLGNMEKYLKLLSTKAGTIADVAKYYVKKNEAKYYSEVGELLEKSKVLMWYPSRETNSSLIVEALPCSESIFNETLSDRCIKEILESRDEANAVCNLSEGCLKFMTKPQQREYMLTHQMLYFQVMEMSNCVRRSQVKKIPKRFQDEFCSNVMRDAEVIAASRYPLSHRDLFMEQIGLCGLWGYKDFYKPHWLSEILQWQQISGCYANRVEWECTDNLLEQNIRTKREEKILEDGCLSHKTTVALLAIAANIRFLTENISQIRRSST